MSDFKPSDRVYVTDSALENLRRILREANGEEPPPNHHGTVDYVDEDFVIINFDDGGAAPYPVDEVRLLEGS